jgi:hypothetical protein
VREILEYDGPTGPLQRDQSIPELNDGSFKVPLGFSSGTTSVPELSDGSPSGSVIGFGNFDGPTGVLQRDHSLFGLSRKSPSSPVMGALALWCPPETDGVSPN